MLIKLNILEPQRREERKENLKQNKLLV